MSVLTCNFLLVSQSKFQSKMAWLTFLLVVSRNIDGYRLTSLLFYIQITLLLLNQPTPFLFPFMITLLLFEGMYCKQYGHCFFPQTLRVKFTSLDVFTLCFGEKLPAAGNLALYSECNDIKWKKQGFHPQIQKAGLTTVYTKSFVT